MRGKKIHPNKILSLGGANAPDLCSSLLTKKTSELPFATNDSNKLNLLWLIPEERKKVNSLLSSREYIPTRIYA